jgi:Protein of unknown function (DUF3712)
MSIGTITLDPIKFNVSSGLWGLKGLRGLVSIDEVDVLGGTQEALLLGTNVTIQNPSNLDLTMGDLGMLFPSSGSSAVETSFTSFFAAVTNTQNVNFELKGSVNVIARTTIGDVPISDISFNVSSTMRGVYAPSLLVANSLSLTPSL